MDAKTLLEMWDGNRKAFRQVVAGIPKGKENFEPGPGSMSLAALALHVVSADKTAVDALSGKTAKWEWDTGVNPSKYATVDGILGVLDAQTEETRKFIAGLGDAGIAKTAALPWGGSWTMERFWLEWILHETHHRGNLITGLRAAGVTPPNIWG